jgi:7-cyano-7-deazaguanine synthase|tara:strand:+ start:3095 stop:3745 length:651 start_codon:yes stop_codon:yes gene_type:complete
MSGGLDSTTLLHWVIKKGYMPFVLSFNYGQRHKKELKFAQNTCKKLKVNHKILDLENIQSLLLGSALTSEDVEVPESHYSHASQKKTVVPNRNAIMINIAIGYAISNRINKIFYAAHYNDRAIYPDCRWEYIQSQNTTSNLANDEHIEIIAPFVEKTKEEIVRLGAELGVSFENTWSCYKGGNQSCGVCGTCRERIEAFQLSKIKDPLKYSIAVEW